MGAGATQQAVPRRWAQALPSLPVESVLLQHRGCGEGGGPGKEDKGGGQQRSVRTEGCRGREKGSDTWLQEMLETAGDNEALRGRESSVLRRAYP